MERLNYHLDKSAKKPLYLQLYLQIRNNIHQQQLQWGERLPSKKKLCEYLQISQNTVENAYAQLLAEGYIESEPRKGFFVSFQSELALSPFQPQIVESQVLNPSKVRWDFNPNKIDSTAFPFEQWKKAARSCHHYQQGEGLSLGEKQGEWALRVQIARYLIASRGVQCEPEQIIVGAGVEYCLSQLILLFNQCPEEGNFHYAMETYGYSSIEKLFALYQKKVIKIPLVNDEQSLDLAYLFQSKANVAYLTPSHLYPFGQVLSISQRQQLIEWVNAVPHRYIIEDDYDSEFRYKGRPIPSLQSLESEKVIYLGSFSKLLLPSLRTAFMVLPKSLLNTYQQICGFLNCPVSRFEQHRLAYFIQQGEFEKHLHRMRKVYRHKMELLCQLLSPYAPKIHYYSEHSGFYLLIELTETPYSIEQLCQMADNASIRIYPIAHSSRKLFTLGFGNLSKQELREGVEKLLEIILSR